MFGRTVLQSMSIPFFALFFASVFSNTLLYSSAFAEEVKTNLFGFTCSLETADGDVADAVLKIGVGDTISLKINELILHNVIMLEGHSHSPSIAFSTNMNGWGVYTLVIHRDFFLPHPEGYDPLRPPATLTIQKANADVVPRVVVYLGECEVF